jgi:hypothetical protein
MRLRYFRLRHPYFVEREHAAVTATGYHSYYESLTTPLPRSAIDARCSDRFVRMWGGERLGCR